MLAAMAPNVSAAKDGSTDAALEPLEAAAPMVVRAERADKESELIVMERIGMFEPPRPADPPEHDCLSVN